MKMRLVMAILSAILCAHISMHNTYGQAKRVLTKTPITTQSATTEDGRKVILKSNGTWTYEKDLSASEQTKSPAIRPAGRQNSTLSFEAGLVFKSGDVKPVARAEFFLLDASLAEILKNAGIKAPREYGVGDSDSDRALVNAYASSIKFRLLPEYENFYPAAEAAIKPHIVQSITTDFNGKASFPAVSSGTYYLMGFSSTPRGYVIWNLPVELKAGQNSITLDQNNAVTAI